MTPSDTVTPVQPWHPTAVLALVATVAFGGCAGGSADTPPTPPTAAELERFVSGTRQPAYWLGRDFEGVAVSAINAGSKGASLTYGEWSCDPGSDCSDPGGVFTAQRPGSIADLDMAEEASRRDCWSRVGKAVAMLNGCLPDGYPQALFIYSGDLEITVTSLLTRDDQSEVSARTVARRLRPLNGNAPWPLPAPEPLSCATFKRVDPRVRQHMPRPLRPTCRP